MHLPANELAQFFRIQSALNNFVYAQLQQVAGRKAKLPFCELPFDKQLEVREAFATNPEYVERFVAENPSGLSADDLEVALGWRTPVTGSFLLMRHLKNYSVFLRTGKEPVAYGVVGLTEPLSRIAPAKALPVFLTTILLPFRQQIVFDGLLFAEDATLDSNARNELKKLYQAVKERDGIITTLPTETDAAPQIESVELTKTVKKKATRTTKKMASTTEVEPRYVVQLCITLLDTKPKIWRRIQVEDCTLDQLHAHIQTAMGWGNSHLHHFWIDGKRFGDPGLLNDDFDSDDKLHDSTKIMLSELLVKKREDFAFGYEYDFGDSWEHEIVFEGLVPAEQGAKYPRCIEGKRACPPDDCGGAPGFENFLFVMADRKHPDHRDLKDWYGGKFDAEKFDPAKATKEMKKGVFDSRTM
jgi:hypothetical protein